MQKEVRDLQQDKQAMQDELRDLQDRLTQFALQLPDDSIGDVVADDSAGTAAGRTVRGKPLNTQQEAVIAEVSKPLCHSPPVVVCVYVHVNAAYIHTLVATQAADTRQNYPVHLCAAVS